MRISSALCCLLSTGLLCACSAPALKDSGQLEKAAAAAARNLNNDNATYIAEARSSQQQADAAELYLYSPTYYSQATEALNKAVELQEKSPEQANANVATQAILAKSLFERGMQIKSQVEIELKNSINFIGILKGLDCPNLMKNEYQDVLQEFRNLTSLIETGKTDKIANEQKDLLREFSKLEQATLTKAYVSKPEQALDEAEDDDADDYAPKTYSSAQKHLETLKNTISQAPRDLDNIKLQSTMAYRAALHAQQVAKAAAGLLNLKQKETEDKVLQTEALLKHIADSLHMEQPVYLSLQEQAFAIAQNAEIAYGQAKSYGSQQGWAEEKQQLMGQIKNLNNKLQALETELNTKTNQQATAPENTTSPAPTEIDNPPVVETTTTETANAEQTTDIPEAVIPDTSASEPTSELEQATDTTATPEKSE